MIKRFFLVIITILYFSGCGGSSVSNEMGNSMTTNKEIIMEQNKKYAVNRGDKIVKLSSSPKIKIEADLENNKSYATLLSGAAKIIRAK